MAISPNDKKQFLVDVKGSAKPNQYWLIRKKDLRHNLFYILAVVPKNSSNQFYILTQERVNRFIDDEFERTRPEQKARGADNLMLGIRWKDAEPEFRDAWSILPS